MNIFGINGGELIVLIVLALLLLGPEKIPEYLRILREWVHKIRVLADGAKEQFKEETDTDFNDVDWQKYDPRQYDPRRVIREALSEPIEDLEASLKDAKTTVHDAADTVLERPAPRPQLSQAEIMAAAVPIDQLDQQSQFPDPSHPEPSLGLTNPEQMGAPGETVAAQPGSNRVPEPPGQPEATLSTQTDEASGSVASEQPSIPLTTPFDAEAT